MSTSADAEDHIITGALNLFLGGKSVRLYVMLQCKIECITFTVQLYYRSSFDTNDTQV